MGGSGAPALYTVEEAARVLRIGRTKAYAMTRQWRDSGGRAGLPVVDFGHLLRVPRAALEDLLGVELQDVPDPVPAERPPAAGDHPAVDPATETTDATLSRPARRSRSRSVPASSAQLDLFDAAS